MSKEHIERLSPSAREALCLTDEERIAIAKEEILVPYDRAKRILDKLESLYTFPKKDRMPNLLIIGESNNGKTKILKRFMKKYGNYASKTTTMQPIVYIHAPKTGVDAVFYESILDAINSPQGSNNRAFRKEQQVINSLEAVGTKMLIIDEFQDVFDAGRAKMKSFLITIKHLSNQLQIPIVAAGVQEVQQAVNVDRQMSSRFEPITLPMWKFDEEFKKLLITIETNLPLKKASLLHTRKLAATLHQMSAGNLGDLMKIIRRATIFAIENGQELIDEEILRELVAIDKENRIL